MTKLPPSLLHRLQTHTRRAPDLPLYTFIDDAGQRSVLSRQALVDRAQALAQHLVGHDLRGKRALLLYPPGLDYVTALWACWYAGVVAVPAYPPDPTRLSRTLPRLETIIADSEACAVLTDSVLASMLQLLPEQLTRRQLRWIATDGPLDDSRRLDASAAPDQLALIQYTSGSTGSPKGVMLSHAQLQSNLAAYADFLGDAGPTLVMWLPQYHDMGLIGGLLAAVQLGQHCIYMPPTAFLRRPARWLKTISEYGATYTGAPNFAFELCTRRVRDEERQELDLSSLAVVCVGAEPTRPSTLQRFADTFAGNGFRSSSFRPCYGLAEVGLFASGGAATGTTTIVHVDRQQSQAGKLCLLEDTTSDNARALVGHGPSPTGHLRLVVEPESRRILGEREVGEIWLAGPSVASGYWKQPALNAEQFGATTCCGRGPFLRTGDLGFVHDGELFITGRLKDLIIIRGRNYHAEDLEATIESAHALCRPGCSAAFSADSPSGECLVVVQELDCDPSDPRLSQALFSAVQRAIDDAVVDAHGVRVDELYLLPPRALPKTSSGKVRRRRCREQLEADELDVLAKLDASVLPAHESMAAAPMTLEDWIATWVAKRRGVPVADIDRSAALNAQGLDSLSFATLTYDLEEHLGLVITDLHKLAAPVSSIEDLARLLGESAT